MHQEVDFSVVNLLFLSDSKGPRWWICGPGIKTENCCFEFVLEKVVAKLHSIFIFAPICEGAYKLHVRIEFEC